jgi:hypothetical protein
MQGCFKAVLGPGQIMILGQHLIKNFTFETSTDFISINESKKEGEILKNTSCKICLQLKVFFKR